MFVPGKAADNHSFPVADDHLGFRFLLTDYDLSHIIVTIRVVLRMQIEHNPIVPRHVRSDDQLDAGFHHFGRRFAVIVNHPNRNLVAHKNLRFYIIQCRNLRGCKHFGRSIRKDIRNGDLYIVI